MVATVGRVMSLSRSIRSGDSGLTVVTTNFTYFLCALYIVATFFAGDSVPFLLSVLLVALCTLKAAMQPYLDSLRLSVNVASVYLFIAPCIFFLWLGSDEYVILLALTVPILDCFVWAAGPRVKLGSNSMFQGPRATVTTYYVWITLLLAAAFGGLLIPESQSGLRMFSFQILFALSLLPFERIIRSADTNTVFRCLFVYFAVVVALLVFYWNGFGRLVVVTYLLIPLLIGNNLRDLGFRVWQAVLVAPLLIALSVYSRSEEVSVERVAGDSGVSHLELSRQIMNMLPKLRVDSAGAFVQQWSLVFLQWVPRAWWEDKPSGLGSLYVDDYLGRRGVSDGHSVATGYIGEQGWLLGYHAAFGGVVYFVTLVVLRALVGRFSESYYGPVAVFDGFFSTYLWGGGASFGARAWFMIIPMLGVIYLLKSRGAKQNAAKGRRN